MESAPWTVTRHDHEVRIDVTEEASLRRVETQAIVVAMEKHLAGDGVTTVRLDGPMLDLSPVPHRLATLATTLAVLVEGQGLRFHLGPI